MKESEVETIVREYIQKKYIPNDWKYPENQKQLRRKSEHGVDISLYNQKKGDRLVIEVKKWSDTNAANHNAFYYFFGQLLSRIKDIPKANYASRRRIVIAAPIKFVELIHNKIHNVKNNEKKGMQGGWALFSKAINLRVWAVNMKTKEVIEYHWKDFLKEDIKA